MSQYAFDAYVPQRQSNNLAIVGFIVSLVGLLGTGGLLCPIGLIISLIALGRPPRGFAIAGAILGFLGTCGGLLVFMLFGAVILAMLGLGMAAAFIAMNDPQRVEITMDMANIAQAVEKYRDINKVPPATLTDLHLATDTLTDPWGKMYVYNFMDEKPGYDVQSDGPDGQPGTTDDIALSRLDELWNKYIQIRGEDEKGQVVLTVGDKSVVVQGDENGGRVTIDTGERKVNIIGSHGAGEITVTDGTNAPLPEPPVPAEPEQPATPASPAPPG